MSPASLITLITHILFHGGLIKSFRNKSLHPDVVQMVTASSPLLNIYKYLIININIIVPYGSCYYFCGYPYQICHGPFHLACHYHYKCLKKQSNYFKLCQWEHRACPSPSSNHCYNSRSPDSRMGHIISRLPLHGTFITLQNRGYSWTFQNWQLATSAASHSNISDFWTFLAPQADTNLKHHK